MKKNDHSYRLLGTDYYLDITLDQLKGARLVLFDQALADELRLKLPNSDEGLERFVLEHFAWFKLDRTDLEHFKSGRQKTFFATRYLDSDSKADGEAMGDGRAVWAGEIVRETDANELRYFDVVLKGTGATPLAWVNHPKQTHKDGQLGLTEAVHEYIYSSAARKNGIDAVAALAVIQLPFMRESENEPAAILVRVGNHLRFAHYRYFADDPSQLTKIFSYGLRRDMGLALDHVINIGDVQAYLERIIHNMATEAAIYFDVHAVHGSPTFGNKTSCGRSIDMATFVYLDAHHAGYHYMPGGVNLLGGEQGQSDQFFNLFSRLLESLKNSGFEYHNEILPIEYFLRRYYEIFESTLTRRWLLRLGAACSDIEVLPASVKENFYEAVKTLYEAKSRKNIPFKKGKFIVAAFEPRKILAGTAGRIADFGNTKQLWEKLFKVDRDWQTYGFADAKPYIDYYVQAVKKIFDTLNINPAEIQAWIERSRTLELSERQEPGSDFFYDNERFRMTQNVVELIKQGGISWREASKAAELASAKFVDVFRPCSD